MKVPPKLSDLTKDQLEVRPVSDDALIYPPVGFLSWPVGGIGNGDEFGYYWPIGKEAGDPLVVMMSHDCGAIIPVASSLESLGALGAYPEITSLLDGTPYPPDDDEEDTDSELRLDKLSLDPRSPFLLVANADAAVAGNELERAEHLYQQAIELLPEYTAAHFGLVTVYRRQRKTAAAVRSMVETIRSPLCFQGASFWADTSLRDLNRSDFRRKCLMWLQQARLEEADRVTNDPIFRLRDRLTFATGLKSIDDFPFYDQAIDEYASQGHGLDAIRLLMLYGELMKCETVSFRERYEFTMPKYRERLLTLCRVAAPERAAFLVGS